MPGYCTVADCSLRLPFALTATSLPSQDQTQAFIDEGYVDINASLAAYGWTTPLEAPAEQAVAKNLNIDYALFRAYTIINERQKGQDAQARYRNGLRLILRGSVQLGDAPSRLIYTDSETTIATGGPDA